MTNMSWVPIVLMIGYAMLAFSPLFFLGAGEITQGPRDEQ